MLPVHLHFVCFSLWVSFPLLGWWVTLLVDSRVFASCCRDLKAPWHKAPFSELPSVILLQPADAAASILWIWGFELYWLYSCCIILLSLSKVPALAPYLASPAGVHLSKVPALALYLGKTQSSLGWRIQPSVEKRLKKGHSGRIGFSRLWSLSS